MRAQKNKQSQARRSGDVVLRPRSTRSPPFPMCAPRHCACAFVRSCIDTLCARIGAVALPAQKPRRQVAAAAADGGGVADEEAGEPAEAVGEAEAETEAEVEDATIEERLASQVLLRGCARESPAPAAGTPGRVEYSPVSCTLSG